MTEAALAMFPLSTVLFPYGRVQLHVFEPRYRRLVADCLAGERRFGVVLIARGSEVGGGDERVDVGTVAWIEAAEALPEGRWHLAVVGGEVLHVRRWLDDDPYPRAVVEEPRRARTEDCDALQRAEAQLRRVLALASELGDVPTVPPSASLGDSPDEVAWRLCALAPISVFDRQRLLQARRPDERLALLLDLLHEVGDDVSRILAGG